MQKPSEMWFPTKSKDLGATDGDAMNSSYLDIQNSGEGDKGAQR